jgi:hypothetical protein
LSVEYDYHVVMEPVAVDAAGMAIIDTLIAPAEHRTFREIQQTVLGSRLHGNESDVSAGYCKNICKRVRLAAVLVICTLVLAACGFGARHGLPIPPGDAPCPVSGSQIVDNGPLATQNLHGPVCRDVNEFQFQEAGQDTEVDLEHSSAGGKTDLYYNDSTGELKLIHGARVSFVYNDNGWDGWPWENEPENRGDFPGEQECRNRTKWLGAFIKDNLEAKFSIFCIKTAEGHDGFLYIRPLPKHKPDAYYVYSYIWVR